MDELVVYAGRGCMRPRYQAHARTTANNVLARVKNFFTVPTLAPALA